MTPHQAVHYCLEAKHTTSFNEEAVSHIHTLTHTVRILYMCAGDTDHLIVCMYVTHWYTYILTYSIHIINMGGNETSVYNMYNTVCTVNALYVTSYLTVGLNVHGSFIMMVFVFRT